MIKMLVAAFLREISTNEKRKNADLLVSDQSLSSWDLKGHFTHANLQVFIPIFEKYFEIYIVIHQKGSF